MNSIKDMNECTTEASLFVMGYQSREHNSTQKDLLTEGEGEWILVLHYTILLLIDASGNHNGDILILKCLLAYGPHLHVVFSGNELNYDSILRSGSAYLLLLPLLP